MPGKPSSSTPWMQSPTGCTKQLMRVAWMSVPAALMMRPAPMAPACRLARNRVSYFSRSSGFSTLARACATRRNRSSAPVSPALRYFSVSTSRLMGCVAVTSCARPRFSLFMLFPCGSIRGRLRRRCRPIGLPRRGRPGGGPPGGTPLPCKAGCAIFAVSGRPAGTRQGRHYSTGLPRPGCPWGRSGHRRVHPAAPVDCAPRSAAKSAAGKGRLRR